jgi:exosortase
MSAVAELRISKLKDVWQYRARRSIRLAWVACLAAPAPLAVLHLCQLWNRTHYQFFPLYILTLAALAWQRWPDSNHDECPIGRNTRFAVRVLLMMELAALLAAVVLFSPWMGYMALLLGFGSLAIRLTGSATGGNLGPIWALAWLLVPPPFELDVRLIQNLQGKTALFSSRLLDLAGHRHLLEGNVLEFAGRQFFVEEACSGIQSLFSLTAIALLYSFWKGRSWLQGFVLVAAGALWALAANTLRVTIIGLVYARAQIDLSSGWPHDMLGYGLLGLAVLMLLSTDELSMYVLGSVVVPRGLGSRNPITLWWNRWVANVAPNPEVQVPIEPRASNEPRAAGEPRVLDEPQFLDEWVSPPHRSLPNAAPSWALVLSFAVLGVLQLVGMAGAAATSFAAAPGWLANIISAEALPESLAAWRCVDSKLEERPPGRNEGLYSRVWKYDAGAAGPADSASQFAAFVSFDYPFADMHELTNCYKGTGWAIRSRQVESCAWREETGEMCVAEMLKPSGESAYLLFVEFDRDGRSARLTPRTTRWLDERLVSNPLVQMFRRGVTRVTLDAGTLYQFQVFVPSIAPLTDEQKQDVRVQFLALRDRLLGQWADGRVVMP